MTCRRCCPSYRYTSYLNLHPSFTLDLMHVMPGRILHFGALICSDDAILRTGLSLPRHASSTSDLLHVVSGYSLYSGSFSCTDGAVFTHIRFIPKKALSSFLAVSSSRPCGLVFLEDMGSCQPCCLSCMSVQTYLHMSLLGV